jgi:hypothetical protein
MCIILYACKLGFSDKVLGIISKNFNIRDDKNEKFPSAVKSYVPNVIRWAVAKAESIINQRETAETTGELKELTCEIREQRKAVTCALTHQPSAGLADALTLISKGYDQVELFSYVIIYKQFISYSSIFIQTNNTTKFKIEGDYVFFTYQEVAYLPKSRLFYLHRDNVLGKIIALNLKKNFRSSFSFRQV